LIIDHINIFPLLCSGNTRILIKLRNIELAQCESQFENLQMSTRQLANIISTFGQYRLEMGDKLVESINTLNSVYEEYLIDQQYTTNELTKLHIIEHNLKIRIAKLTELIQLSQALNQRYYRIEQLIKEFTDLANFANQNFIDLNKVYPL